MRIRLSILSGLLLILSSVSVQAKIWTVDSNQGNSAADFKTAQAAHDSAMAGDTLYFSGSSVSYGNLTATKQLTYVGPGYFLSENIGLQANPAAARFGTVRFDPGSDNSIIMGTRIEGGIEIEANNLTIKRNQVYDGTVAININPTYSSSSNVSNVIIAQNYLTITSTTSSATYSPVYVHENCTGVFVINNFMQTKHSDPTAQSAVWTSATNTDVQVINNVLRGNVVLGDLGTFNNNILREGDFSAPKIIHRNNLCDSTQFGAEDGNQENVDMGTVFDTTYTSSDGKWQLQADSPAMAAGLNGEDLGMFGGMSPYVLSGIPPIPSIYHFTAPITGSRASGLPVRIKVRSNK